MIKNIYLSIIANESDGLFEKLTKTIDGKKIINDIFNNSNVNFDILIFCFHKK
ncbi:hypothetical protein ACOTWJ_07345 [Aliarcobacter butzleri]